MLEVPPAPQGAVQRNPLIPDNIFELERKETAREYAMTYGDEIAVAYENDKIVYVPHFALPLDAAFFQEIAFPTEWKKVGTSNGITRDCVVYQHGQLILNQEHPFFRATKDSIFTIFCQHQMAMTVTALEAAAVRLFPRYRSLRLANATFRFVETMNEGMHIDSFGGGAELTEHLKRNHRVKIFINIDSLPRRWNTSYDIWQIIERYRDKLAAPLVNDINVVNKTINDSGVLQSVLHHSINFPQLSAVIANGETIAHQVIFGRRAIVGEFICSADDMITPALNSHSRLSKLLK